MNKNPLKKTYSQNTESSFFKNKSLMQYYLN